MIDNINHIDDEKMENIKVSVGKMKNLVHDLVSHKKHVIFTDKFMSKEIFEGIRLEKAN